MRVRIAAAVVAVLLVASYGCGGTDTSAPWNLTEPDESKAAEETPTENADSSEKTVPEPNEGPEKESEEEVPTPKEHPGAEFFGGLWLIDQPYHALYEATLYDFRRDGTLVEVDSHTLGGPVPTGRVTECLETHTETDEQCNTNGSCQTVETSYCAEFGAVCIFGDYWYTQAEDVLVVGLRCSDDVDREATLDFDGFPETFNLAPIDITVDGESGWARRSFEWSWTRCQDVPEDVCQLPED